MDSLQVASLIQGVATTNSLLRITAVELAYVAGIITAAVFSLILFNRK